MGCLQNSKSLKTIKKVIFIILRVQHPVSELDRTQGAEGSQPAMKTRNEAMNKMYKIKDVNVHMNVMNNMCACYCCVLKEIIIVCC